MLSATEFTRWRLIEGIEPFGERRQDFRFAIAFSKLLQSWGAKISASDLLSAFIDPFEDTSPVDDEAARAVKMEAAAMAYATIIKPPT